jgi:hypothetical protein
MLHKRELKCKGENYGVGQHLSRESERKAEYFSLPSND